VSEHEFSLPHILLLLRMLLRMLRMLRMLLLLRILRMLLLWMRMPWQLSMAEFQAQVSALQQRIDGAALRDKKAATAAAAAAAH
jgi:hypothetical protein